LTAPEFLAIYDSHRGTFRERRDTDSTEPHFYCGAHVVDAGGHEVCSMDNIGIISNAFWWGVVTARAVIGVAPRGEAHVGP
jgi:hypothetical protein